MAWCRGELLLGAALLVAQLAAVGGSVGDRSDFHTTCLTSCIQHNCTRHTAEFRAGQSVWAAWLQWECEDVCDYSCMWRTVQHFTDQGLAVPQFRGKWPFVALWGVQEPASVLFSLLNMAAHLYMILHFRSHVPAHAPLYWLWHGCALVSVNAWIWSTVFHTRDLPFTEMLDYFSTFSCVLYLLFTLFARLLVWRPVWHTALPATALLLVYVCHVTSMVLHFDYGRNMIVNITAGLVNSLGWVTWCCYMYVKHKQHYVWKGAAVVLATNLFLLLEVNDFPPCLWVFDAHSLWHAGTAPLPLLWYRFCEEDSMHLQEQSQTLPHLTPRHGKKKAS